jgi:hypothetical protein
LKKRTLIANPNSSPRHFACPAAKAGGETWRSGGEMQFLSQPPKEGLTLILVFIMIKS